jgi:hypothetical protein
MRYKTERRMRVIQHGPEGQERALVEHYDERVPKLPRDWDQLAVKVAAGLVLALTMVAVVWSTFSIGALLRGGIGYAAASLFDIAWLVNVLLEWLARYDRSKRRFSRVLGWALLVCTMGAIGWHGVLAGSIALAVVGASVSLFAKTLWLGIMRHIDRDLSELDQQWVEQEISKANALLAVSGVRRQVARAENRAAMELLAAERERSEFAAQFGLESAGAVSVPVESVFGDAVTSRRRDVISPAGEGADIRPDTAPAQVTDVETVPDVLPEAPDSPAPLFQAPEPVPAQAPVPQVPEDEPRPSLASAVRSLVAGGVTDPKVITATASALIGHQAKAESVAREIRNARAALTSTRDAYPQGQYL